jgi:hypothetical protein
MEVARREIVACHSTGEFLRRYAAHRRAEGLAVPHQPLLRFTRARCIAVPGAPAGNSRANPMSLRAGVEEAISDRCRQLDG